MTAQDQPDVKIVSTGVLSVMRNAGTPFKRIVLEAIEPRGIVQGAR